MAETLETYTDTVLINGRWADVRKPTRLSALAGKTITVYKKAFFRSPSCRPRGQHAIITLRIAHNTQRMQPKNYKCRAASAKVIEIRSMASGRKLSKAYSFHRNEFIYRPGETVRPILPYDPRHKECASGIHFFLTKQEAEAYY